MIRSFREHYVRHVTDLAGIWQFAFLGDVDPDTQDPGQIAFDDRMAVPACFDATPAYAGKRGLAAYRRTLHLSPGLHRLRFDGVHHWCRLFVNGQSYGEHVGGFTQFCADFEARAGGNEIVLLVDNRLDPTRCPLHLDYFDWYHYGGIARGVELHQLGQVTINWMRAVTEDLESRRVSVFIDFQTAGKPGSVPLTIACGGRNVVEEVVDLAENEGRLKRTFELEGAALWSPDAPNLHELYVRLGDDDLRERIGLRQIQTADRQVLINGEPIRLLGVNRHEAHPQFGHTVPESLALSDVQQLKQLGCNFVRGCHYPQDQRFLDLCDEAGICVWVESIGWGHGVEHLTDSAFVEAQQEHVGEMVLSSWNHPSVLMWGILNESASDDLAARPCYEKLLGMLRELDPTRPVTYACNRVMKDVDLDLVDIISINVYPGWYGGDIDTIPDAMAKFVEEMNKPGRADKPMIVSEIGAGAIYGWRDAHEEIWSEQYQAKLLSTVIDTVFRRTDRICGLAIWQFGDCRTGEVRYKALGRPRVFNNKGLVDEYRRPKMAFDVVAKAYRDLSGQID